MRNRQSFVYIATNKFNSVLYTGVTGDLIKRGYEHKIGVVSGFTSKYKIHKLVYYEIFDDISEAIKREKQIKDGSRKKKIELVMKMNPEFRDLYEDIVK
ncbi:MAG: GIY-YIG nuclease family protein [Candidatus Gottesmanbacteria bacterium]